MGALCLHLSYKRKKEKDYFHYRKSPFCLFKSGAYQRYIKILFVEHAQTKCLYACMAHFTAKETAAVCKIFTEEEQASSGRIIHKRIIHGKQRHNIRIGRYSFSRNSWNRKYWITRFMRVITDSSCYKLKRKLRGYMRRYQFLARFILETDDPSRRIIRGEGSSV